eukprot:302782-Rhodomonas_salina.3
MRRYARARGRAAADNRCARARARRTRGQGRADKRETRRRGWDAMRCIPLLKTGRADERVGVGEGAGVSRQEANKFRKGATSLARKMWWQVALPVRCCALGA